MKLLDRYILWSYLKIFFAVFVILTVIFVFQTVWLYISELAGKDLSADVIGKFLIYFTPNLMPLILPLTVLVTSIMTFGNFAENYEFAAMKSAGISLQRAMRSLIVFIFGIAILAFFFANNIIPIAAYKSINLRKNIAQLQPSMAIVEGAFNDLNEINIKVDEKYGSNDQYLKHVIIHQKPERNIGDITVIKAKRGELMGSTESDLLSLVLFEGNYYNDIYKKKHSERSRKPFAKSYFEEYTINIDLSDFNNVDLGDEKYSNSYKMLKISELKIEIDSLSADFNQDKQTYKHNIATRQGLDRITPPKNKDHAYQVAEKGDSVLVNYDNFEKNQVLKIALGSLNGTIATIASKKEAFKRKQEVLNKFEIALHEKYVIGVACIILFFVGAPLGAIIRKGGMGLPLVIAILLFLTYHFIGVLTKNSAENGAISPFIACWLSTFIMFPLSIYLTYRATTDQGFFNPDVIMNPVRKFLRKIGISKKD